MFKRHQHLGVVLISMVVLASMRVSGEAQAQPAASVPARPRNVTIEEWHRALVLSFYDKVFNKHDLQAADQFLSEDYIQHNPRVATGRAAFKSFISSRFSQFPEARSTIVRSATSGDLVFLHVHAQNDAKDRGVAIVDIFRVESGKIVEHWDVVQPVPETSANDNGMF